MTATITPIRASEARTRSLQQLAREAHAAATAFDDHIRACPNCLRPRRQRGYGRPWCLVGCALKDRELRLTRRYEEAC